MSSNFFIVACNLPERKIIFKSLREEENRIVIKSKVTGSVLWDSNHVLSPDYEVWISPNGKTGYTDSFIGGFLVEFYSMDGESLGVQEWNAPEKKKVLFITPHLSTGGCPQYLYRKIVEHTEEIEAYVVEWDNIGGDAFVVQKNRIIDWVGSNRLFTLGED
jgi:hypothetical protein